MNLADAPIDISGGRPLDRYGAETQLAVDRIAGAAAVWIAAPVYRASFPGVLKDLVDIAPVGGTPGKAGRHVAIGGSTHHYFSVDTQLRRVRGRYRALVADRRLLTGADFRGRPADVGNCAQGFSRAR
jgi:NAD(P)H-dependent FMN reductase